MSQELNLSNIAAAITSALDTLDPYVASRISAGDALTEKLQRLIRVQGVLRETLSFIETECPPLDGDDPNFDVTLASYDESA